MKKALLAALLILAVYGVASWAVDDPTISYMASTQWTFNKDCAAQGDTVVTAMDYGIQIWDMGTPAVPVLLDNFRTTAEAAWACDWLDTVIVVSTIDGDSYLVNSTDPEDLTLIGMLPGVSLGANADLDIVDDAGTIRLCSAGDGTRDFQVWDITDASVPALDGWLSIAGGLNSVCANDTVAYATSKATGVYSIDISDPAHPAVYDVLELYGTHVDVSVSGANGAVASGSDGFTLFDCTDPTALVEHASVGPEVGDWTDLKVQSVVVRGDTLFAMCENAGPMAYDISDLDAPTLFAYAPVLDTTAPPDSPYYTFYGAVVSDSTLYAAHWGHDTPGVNVFDLKAAAGDSLPLDGYTRSFDYVRDIAVGGALDSLVIGCTGNSGLVVNGHPSAGVFRTLGVYAGSDEVWGATIVDTLVYGASTLDGLIIVNVKTPASPTLKGHLDVGQARAVVVADTVAYVSAYSNGLFSVDVSDPASPVQMDSATYPGMRSVNLAKRGNLLVTADSAGGMNVWSVVDPDTITHLHNYSTGGARALDVALSSDQMYAYLVVEGLGVQIVDLMAMDGPELVATFAAGATGVDRDGARLWVSRGQSGISLYTLLYHPWNPDLVSMIDTPTNAINVKGVSHGNNRYVYVADRAGLGAYKSVLGKPASDTPQHQPSLPEDPHPKPEEKDPNQSGY